MKWIRHYADVQPTKGVVLVMRQVYESNNPKGYFKKKNLKVDTVLIKKIETEIPFEFIDIDTEHFDSKAFQSDDRFFSTKKTIKRYSQDAINTEMQKALIGFNTTPEQIP